MRIGDVNIEPVPPTRRGLYLVRSKAADYTWVHLVSKEPWHEKPMVRFEHDEQHGEWKDADLYDCFGPLMFPAQANKVHTTYKVDFVTPTPGNAGGFAVKGN